MKFKEFVELKGVPGSPYTRKMLALLRYRRIPYRLIQRARFQVDPDIERFPEKPAPKVELLPTFYCLDENDNEIAVCDTTPVIRHLEAAFVGRSTIPATPALAFVNDLLEDYADEWLTKAMFHYRWNYEADIQKAGQMLPRWGNSNADESLLQAKSAAVSKHQVSRLSYVGSNPITKDTIESSLKRFLELFDKHLQSFAFLLGKRPASCDFAVYGQLTCMALFDPTPQELIVEHYPRIYAWTECMEDLSGYETLDGDWLDAEVLPDTLIALLAEIGRVYAPYLTANSAAAMRGDKEFTCDIEGKPWQQNVFPYQAKCLQWLKQGYEALDPASQDVALSLCQKTNNIGIIS